MEKAIDKRTADEVIESIKLKTKGKSRIAKNNSGNLIGVYNFLWGDFFPVMEKPANESWQPATVFIGIPESDWIESK